MDSDVAEEFEQCLYLLIVNIDDLSTIDIKNDESSEGLYGEKLAAEIPKYDCEAVIAGKIKSIAFDKLADACVIRYLCTSNSVKNAL